jgi:hypothetical protein
MESNQFIKRLVKWAFLSYEYDFDFVHKVGRINQDVDGLNQNPILARRILQRFVGMGM